MLTFSPPTAQGFHQVHAGDDLPDLTSTALLSSFSRNGQPRSTFLPESTSFSLPHTAKVLNTPTSTHFFNYSQFRSTSSSNNPQAASDSQLSKSSLALAVWNTEPSVAPTVGGSFSFNDSAASIRSSISWGRDPACSTSWKSRVEANNGTVMTTKVYSYTVALSTLTTTTFRLDAVVSGPATKTYNAGTVTYQVGPEDVCCGQCLVGYPNVRVMYWPVNNTDNRWCLKYNISRTADPTNNDRGHAIFGTIPEEGLSPTEIPAGSSGDDEGPAGLPDAPPLPTLTAAAALPNVPDIPQNPPRRRHARTFVPLNKSDVYAISDGFTLCESPLIP